MQLNIALLFHKNHQSLTFQDFHKENTTTFQMAEDPKKLLFRLQHIIPQKLSPAVNVYPTEATTSSLHDFPMDIEFQMTWGKVAAKTWGPPDGRPVFALHGWLDNAGTFDTLIPLLPKSLRIVAVDTAGHGLSDHYPPDIAYNFFDCLVAIERLAGLLKWKKFSLIGHSMGAAMSMLYAGVFPEKVDTLVCLDLARAEVTRPETVGLRLRKTVGKLLKYEAAIVAGPEKPFTYEVAIEKSISGSFGSLNRNACELLFKRGLKQVDGGYVFRRDRRLMAAPLTLTPKEDQLAMAREVTANVLIIKFAQGPDFESRDNFMEHVENLKTKAKNVFFVEVDGTHHVHLTNPNRVASIISDFLNAPSSNPHTSVQS
ncbi:serine hydrolase-like protein isoform X1 [Daphnia magna]|uniref:serine hydrolase-like protein isoform X1 n=2 Tax=Daphnia magna TaxID=35525 RepID=UPI001402CD89|nr:serine hydrolase-like protein isoform X1 [Daphnia magna]